MKVRRRLGVELLEIEQNRSRYCWTCKTCGYKWETWQVIAAALAKKMENYWKDGASGYCPKCTKKSRDERYPLPRS